MCTITYNITYNNVTDIWSILTVKCFTEHTTSYWKFKYLCNKTLRYLCEIEGKLHSSKIMHTHFYSKKQIVWMTNFFFVHVCTKN